MRAGTAPQLPGGRHAIGERAVGIARNWIGTPYRHQASVRGAGCDCLGLLRGIWREIHGGEPAEIPPYTPDWDEPQGREVLARAAAELLIPLGPEAPWRPGQVLLFRMKPGGVAKHLGLLSDPGTNPAGTAAAPPARARSDPRQGARFIHAYTRHGVIESPLSLPWQRRIAGRFDWPERAD